MHCRSFLRYRWNHRRKGAVMGRYMVHQRMEVQYYCAWWQNHHLAVVQLIGLLSFACARSRGEWCQLQSRSTSSSSNDTVDEDPCFVRKMKCPYNVQKCLDGYLATHTFASQLVLGKSCTSIYFCQKGSYHSHRISLILFHTFAKCIITISISTSFWARKEYRIQLITAIVLHPHKTLPRPLPDLWLSHFVRFVLYMNRAFFLDTNPPASSWGTRTRARTNECDITAEHAFSCLCDEHKRSVDESGCLDDAKEIDSSLSCSQDDVAGSRNPSKPIHIFALPAHHTYNLHNVRHTLLISTSASHHHWQYIQQSRLWFGVTHIQYPPLNHWPPSRTYNGMWCLLVAEISRRRC